jgi:hypothetical protein
VWVVLLALVEYRRLLLQLVGLVDHARRRFGALGRGLGVDQGRLVERGLLFEEVRFGDLVAGVDAVVGHCCSSFTACS